MKKISNNFPIRLTLLLSIGFFGLVFGGRIGTDIIGAFLVFLALLGRAHTLTAFLLFPIVKLANPALVEYSSVLGIGFWLALFFSFLRNIRLILQTSYLRAIWPMWLFAFSAFCSSVLYSENLDVSLLKLLSLVMAITTITAITSKLETEEIYSFEKTIKTIMVFVVCISIPFYFFPAIGFLRNKLGFQGVFNHPQAFAVFLVPILSYLLMSIFQRDNQSKNWLIIPLSIVTILVLTTKARTALAASVLSTVIPVFITVISRSIYAKYINRKKFVLLSTLFVMTFLIGITFSDTFYSSVVNYIHKDKAKESISQSFYRSRGANVENHIENFKESPIFGWGFGVIPHGMHIDQGRTFMGLPISAPVEKGFLFTAVLEETGGIGFLLFLFWIIKMLLFVAAKEKPIYIACFLSCILLNFGEAVMFSIGGLGLIFWVTMGFILARSSISKTV